MFARRPDSAARIPSGMSGELSESEPDPGDALRITQASNRKSWAPPPEKTTPRFARYCFEPEHRKTQRRFHFEARAVASS